MSYPWLRLVHIHFAAKSIPFIYPQGEAPCSATTTAADHWLSSKSGEFNPGDQILLHFQLSLVTSPLLNDPSIPESKIVFLPSTETTLVSPGITKFVAFLQSLLSCPRLSPSANISMEWSQVKMAVKSGMAQIIHLLILPKQRPFWIN